MALRMGYAAMRWRQPDLSRALPELKKAGWDGWEGRLPLDWLGPPRRLKQVCEDADMPLCVFTASGSPEDRDWEHVERNKRRMDFAAEMGVNCFMFMSGSKPADRAVSEDDIKQAAESAESAAARDSQRRPKENERLRAELKDAAAKACLSLLGCMDRLPWIKTRPKSHQEP